MPDPLTPDLLSFATTEERQLLHDRALSADDEQVLMAEIRQRSDAAKPPKPPEPTKEQLIAFMHSDELPHYLAGNASQEWWEGIKARWRAACSAPEPREWKNVLSGRSSIKQPGNSEPEKGISEPTSEANKPVRPIPFANPSKEYLRRDRIERAIQLGGRPDPNDLAEEKVERIRYQQELRDSYAKKLEELRSSDAHPMVGVIRGLEANKAKHPARKSERTTGTEIDISKLSPEALEWLRKQTDAGAVFTSMEDLNAAYINSQRPDYGNPSDNELGLTFVRDSKTREVGPRPRPSDEPIDKKKQGPSKGFLLSFRSARRSAKKSRSLQKAISS